MDIGFLSFLQGQKVTTKSLVGAISSAVKAGVLVQGDSMPSTREISMVTGVSRTTVVRAFDELVARGLLVAVRGSGTMVADARPPEPVNRFSSQAHAPKFSWSEKYSEIGQRLAKQQALVTTSADFDDLNNFAVPPDLLPTKEWRRLVAACCQERIDVNLAGRKEIFGSETLRASIAKFLRRSHGIVCSTEQIVLYSGPQSALAHLADLMVQPGQVAVCENPGYQGAREQFRVHGAEVIAAPVDAEGLKVDQLNAIEGSVDWLYVSSSCQDPTGVVMPETRRRQLLEWCQKNKTAIIEDAWDSDFHYGSQAVPALFSLDGSDSVIYLYSFSRLLYPLSSLSVLVIPENLIALFKNSKYLSDRQFPTLEHHVLTEMLDSGSLDHYIRSIWKTFRKRRQALLFEMKRCLKENVTLQTQGAGMHIIVRFDQRWNADYIVQAARMSNLPLVPTNSYYIGDAPGNEFIAYFAGVPVQQAQTAVEKFAAALMLDEQVSSAS